MVDEKRITEKVITCECVHAGAKVTVSTIVIHPADHLPDQPPRIVDRECSHIAECNLLDKCACPFAVGKFTTSQQQS
jgi:hypothetical protein